MKKAVLHADGASLGNPGDAGIGVLIESGGKKREISEYIGVATNNVAEYSAFIRGLEEAKKMGATDIDVYLDSELIVKQINGEYKVKSAGLREYHLRAKALLKSFRKSSVTHIPREENKAADRLSKKGAAPGKKHGTPASVDEKSDDKPQECFQDSLPFR